MRAQVLENGANWWFDISNISGCVFPLLSIKLAETVMVLCKLFIKWFTDAVNRISNQPIWIILGPRMPHIITTLDSLVGTGYIETQE